MPTRNTKATENKTAIRRLIEEAWNQGNLGAVEELVAPEAIDHDPARPANLPQGREGLRESVSMFRAAFPDLRLSIDEIFAHEDKVLWRWHSEGTQAGAFQGLLPTNKRGEVTGISIARFENGKVVESWSEWDNLGLLRQLGVAPSAGSRGEWLSVQAQRLSVRAREAATRLRERANQRRRGTG